MILQDQWPGVSLRCRGKTEIKGKGEQVTWWIDEVSSGLKSGTSHEPLAELESKVMNYVAGNRSGGDFAPSSSAASNNAINAGKSSWVNIGLSSQGWRG